MKKKESVQLILTIFTILIKMVKIVAPFGAVAPIFF